ncbi:isoprenyl transferase [Eubacterium sp. MSJ-33]|uniref:isoprenyl transferase n=1 Tax=Eubacterium sp. MSJ-33 TaxID=2841528 RepID=UPI001C753028|nr:isoprenyl transferase [Eubacterium sp. MSJ-33]QWT53197.1 isoprenyl transferase [Eubacterium sp. MSJ-33]
MKKIIDGEQLEIPTHVAIIMDGNGRWAKKRLLPRNMGHKQGAKVLEQICRDAADLGIRYLTVYAFSTENWKRSTEEVTGIMNLLRSYLSNCVERASKDGLRIRVIGDRSALDADIVEMLENAERETAKFDKLDFTIALNYGGRDELRRTMTKLAKQVQDGTLAPEDITEDVISDNLDTADLPDPDLLIRTSGELRLSNYLVWQLAYAEFYFTDTLWPDFNKESLKEAIRYYNGRERRFGGVK